MRKTTLFLFLVLLAAGAAYWWGMKIGFLSSPDLLWEQIRILWAQPAPAPTPALPRVAGEGRGGGQPSAIAPTPTPADEEEAAKKKQDLEDLKKQMLASLSKKPSRKRLLSIPKLPPQEPEDKFSRTIEKVVAQEPVRAEGIKKRRSFPVGVVIYPEVRVFKSHSKKEPLFKMRTGDFVKIYPDQNDPNFLLIHPGSEIFLAATSKKTEVAGTLYPDEDGWIDKNLLHQFDADEAKEFTETTDPITLGNDPNFSTVSFYEEAFNNPDPVVHRVIGPRFISILSLHEDYLASWKDLYRDPDSKIRSITLASLKQRGVGHSRRIVEDLIRRLSELTAQTAQGETESEVITILTILKESCHPRVPVALSSYVETWESTQTPTVVAALKETIAAFQ